MGDFVALASLSGSQCGYKVSQRCDYYYVNIIILFSVRRRLVALSRLCSPRRKAWYAPGDLDVEAIKNRWRLIRLRGLIKQRVTSDAILRELRKLRPLESFVSTICSDLERWKTRMPTCPLSSTAMPSISLWASNVSQSCSTYYVVSSIASGRNTCV